MRARPRLAVAGGGGALVLAGAAFGLAHDHVLGGLVVGGGGDAAVLDGGGAARGLGPRTVLHAEALGALLAVVVVTAGAGALYHVASSSRSRRGPGGRR